MDRSHEVNKLYDGILNKIHHFFYSNYISTNENFTLREDMKQEERISFVDEMDKVNHDH